MSQFHSVLQSVRLGFSRLPVAGSVVSLSTLLHSVEASHIASCRGSHARFPFLFPVLLVQWSKFDFMGGLHSSDADGSPFLSGLFWETACASTEPAERARGIAHPLASDFRGEGEVARAVFDQPCRQRDCIPRI